MRNCAFCTVVLFAVAICHVIALAQNLTISQIDWLAADGGYLVQNSEWGTANIQFQPGDESKFTPCTPIFYCAYLQVVTWTGDSSSPYNWAVQNMPIMVHTGSDFADRVPDSFAFNIGFPRGVDASTDSSYQAAVTVTLVPLPTMPNVPLSILPVGKAQWLWGNGLAGQAVPPIAQNFIAFADDTDEKFESKIKIKETDVEAVDEELNGCGPGGGARSLRYLAKQGSITLNQTAQQVYTTLKGANYMKTDLGVNGKGTTNANFQSGKDAYSKNRNLKVTTEATATAAFIKDDVMAPMNKGADVEVVIDKGKNNGNDLGGHIAFVSEIILTRDKKTENVTSFKVKFIDDPIQGNGKAENRTTGNWMEFDVTYDDKQMEHIALKGWGTGATLQQFFVETATK